MWALVANKGETQLCPRANFVSLIGDVDNPDGSKKTKLRRIALPETFLKQIESDAVDVVQSTSTLGTPLH